MGGSIGNWLIWFIVLSVVSLLAVAQAQAQDKPKTAPAKQDTAKPEPAKPAQSATGKTEAKTEAKDDKHEGHSHAPAVTDPRFEQMKKLVGKWKGTATHGDGKFDTTVSYKLIGEGSALVETLFEGEPHEMITVYHMDGSDLVFTHYCAAGNQPRCKAIKSDAKSIKFDFVGGANIKPEHDMHMHAMELNWVGDDKIKTVWTSWADGKPGESATFELERVK